MIPMFLKLFLFYLRQQQYLIITHDLISLGIFSFSHQLMLPPKLEASFQNVKHFDSDNY